MEPNTNMLDEATNLNNESTIHKHKYYRLNRSLAKIIDDYALVKFQPFDVSDEESINDCLLVIDNILQYGEDFDVKEPKEVDDEEDQDENRRETVNGAGFFQ